MSVYRRQDLRTYLAAKPIDNMLNIELHLHTHYSKDSLLPLKKIVSTCKKRKINGVAVTDHNTIKGALELKEMSPFKVVVGEEISTNEGEIIGYFLKEEISPRLSPEETIEKIRDQNGIVCIPHPFDYFRKARITGKSLERIVDRVDMVEVFNSRNVVGKSNDLALQLARDHNLACVVGSDAHLNREIGMSYIVMEDFSGPQDFLMNLKNARLVTRKSSLLVHLQGKIITLIKRRGYNFKSRHS